MADRGALRLLLPLSPRMSTFLNFSNLHLLRFQNSILSSPFDSHHLNFSSSPYTVDWVKVVRLNLWRFSYKICAVTEERGGYIRMERGKRRRKRRKLWEEFFEDNVEDNDDNEVDDGGGGVTGKFDLWKILEEIVDNVWILKAFKSYGYLLPFIIVSLFSALDLRLSSLVVAIGPSLLFYAFQKLIGWDKRRTTSMANQ